MIKVNVDGKQAASWVQAALLLSGLSLISYGLYIVLKPLGFVFAGIMLFGIGLLLNKITEK